mgnify:CR=1 FL=1
MPEIVPFQIALAGGVIAIGAVCLAAFVADVVAALTYWHGKSGRARQDFGL